LSTLHIIVSRRKTYDAVIILPAGFLLPSVVGRACGKKVALFVAQKPGLVMTISARINFRIANLILYESPNILADWNIQHLAYKCLHGFTFVDISSFRFVDKLNASPSVVGFLGELEKRKGILEFIESIKILNSRGSAIRFVIGGYGCYAPQVAELAAANDNVEFRGAVPRKILPSFLADLSLLVVPSYSEGVPGIILESMSCGIQVLASPVGGIPDVVRDGKTGFLMEDNSPISIAENILRALNSPNLERIRRDSRAFIERDLTIDSAIQRYRTAMQRLLSDFDRYS
jgi:glycosyltransferase involved in cell wall biosynthesis